MGTYCDIRGPCHANAEALMLQPTTAVAVGGCSIDPSGFVIDYVMVDLGTFGGI